MGFGTGLTSSTLLKLGEQTNSTISQLTSIFFTRSCGVLGGTTLAGMLIDKFHDFGTTFLTVGIFIMSISTLLIPFIYRLIMLIPLQFAWGLSAGIVENLNQVLTIRYYSNHNVSPYLQSLHSAFGIGACTSPLIVAEFLSEKKHKNQWHYAYFIIFFLHIPDLIWLSCYSIRNEWIDKAKPMNRSTIVEESEEFIQPNPVVTTHLRTELKTKPEKRPFLFILLLAPFLFCYVGCEYGFISYLYAYATIYLKFSKEAAAYLNSAFWASFIIGRLCGIVISLRFSPQIMIIVDLIGCIVSLIVLLIFNKVPLILWIGSILFAFFIASIYSSTIAYAEKHITVTGKRMSMFIVAAATGDATIPLLVGMIIKFRIFGYPSFIIVALFIIVLAFLFFILNVLYTTRSFLSSDKDVKEKSKIQDALSK